MSRTRTAEETKTAMHKVVAEMYDRIIKGEPPTMTLPVRTKTNIGFDKKLGVYKYGKKQSVRDATSLGSAKQLLRTLHVVEFIEEMLDAGKSLSFEFTQQVFGSHTRLAVQDYVTNECIWIKC